MGSTFAARLAGMALAKESDCNQQGRDDGENGCLRRLYARH
jgi:hypothetical protein